MFALSPRLILKFIARAVLAIGLITASLSALVPIGLAHRDSGCHLACCVGRSTNESMSCMGGSHERAETHSIEFASLDSMEMSPADSTSQPEVNEFDATLLPDSGNESQQATSIGVGVPAVFQSCPADCAALSTGTFKQPRFDEQAAISARIEFANRSPECLTLEHAPGLYYATFLGSSIDPRGPPLTVRS